jgi:hypothetical protein
VFDSKKGRTFAAAVITAAVNPPSHVAVAPRSPRGGLQLADNNDVNHPQEIHYILQRDMNAWSVPSRDLPRNLHRDEVLHPANGKSTNDVGWSLTIIDVTPCTLE